MSGDDLRKIADNLNRKIRELRTAQASGLMKAGKYILHESSERVPVEYGKLKASGYVHGRQEEDAYVVTVGFSANYAGYVHENMEQKLAGKPRPSGLGVYWGPHGQPKYLQSVLDERSYEILRLITKG